MKPLWHPISTVLIADPRCFATPHVLRMLLDAEAEVQLVYAGDRMWPTVAHGSSFTAGAVDTAALRCGDVLLACPAGVTDLLRLVGRDGDRFELAADADPDTVVVPPETVLARARVGGRPGGAARRLARRIYLDLREACSARPDPRGDPARTVQEKYDNQAVFYARSEAPELDAALEARIRESVPSGGQILVIGSGAGRECFALARAGWSITGVDFSAAMVELSTAEAARRGLSIEFHAADIRHHDQSPGSLAGVLFTYDVYSFLPRRAERIRLLQRIRGWLRPRGVAYLSARRVRSSYHRLALGAQWLALRRHTAVEWGASHTRWIAADGTLHRSFVRVFTDAQLGGEIAAAGFRLEHWEAGHGLLRPTDLL